MSLQIPTQIKHLDSVITKNGFEYRQIQKLQVAPKKSIAIYSQHEKSSNEDDIIAYEVFIIPYRNKPVQTPTKVWLPEGEVFPSNEKFGSFAKSIYVGKRQNRQRAFVKALQYVQEFKQHILDNEK